MDKRINEFIQCIVDTDWAIYQENNRYHISAACLTTNEHLKHRIVDLLISWIEKIQPASIICISEGMDQGIFSLTTWVSLKLQKPFYAYNMDEPLSDPSEIRSNISNCTLLLPYSSEENEILRNLKFIENLGGYVKQIIVIVNESEHITQICNSKKIDLIEYCNTLEVINELEKIGSPKAYEIISHLKYHI